MNVEFIEALNELCKTRRIKKEVLLEAIEQALMSAYKKNFDSASNARVTLDAITGEVAVYATLPATLVIEKSDDISEIRVSITEGKYHQVKRMFEAVGKQVLFLKRLSMGTLQLDESLTPGSYRALTTEELSALKNRTI